MYKEVVISPLVVHHQVTIIRFQSLSDYISPSFEQTILHSLYT
jgi:hypothetical protein